MMGTDFESVVNKLPFSVDKLTGMAISWFLTEQEPESVDLDVFDNGYVIKVRTDEQNIKETVEFWRDYVAPELSGSDDE